MAGTQSEGCPLRIIYCTSKVDGVIIILGMGRVVLTHTCLNKGVHVHVKSDLDNVAQTDTLRPLNIFSNFGS